MEKDQILKYAMIGSMLVAGIVFLIRGLVLGEHPKTSVACALIMITVAVEQLLTKPDIRRTMGVVAMATGVAMVPFCFVHLSYDDTSTISTILYVLMLFVSSFLAGIGFMYYRGALFSKTPILVSSLAFSCVYIIEVLALINHGAPAGRVAYSLLYGSPMIFVGISIAMSSCDRYSQSSLIAWNMDDSRDSFCAISYTDPRSFLTHEELAQINELLESKIPEQRIEVDLLHEKKSRSIACFQYAPEGMYIILKDSEAKSFLIKPELMIRSILPVGGGIEDCTLVKMFGDDGVFIQLIVHEVEPTLIESIRQAKIRKNLQDMMHLSSKSSE